MPLLLYVIRKLGEVVVVAWLCYVVPNISELINNYNYIKNGTILDLNVIVSQQCNLLSTELFTTAASVTNY